MKIIFIITLVGAFVNVSLSQNVQKFDYESLVGTESPNFNGRTLSGKDFDFIDKKGKNIMLVFWSKYCGGCNKEQPDLNRIIEEMKGNNFELISVIDESTYELTNSDTTKYSLRIYPVNSGFYEYNRPIFYNKKINYEIITEGKSIRQKFGLPNSSPIILFIDESLRVIDYSRAYYIYNNYEHLKEKLDFLMHF